jgi:hypothetical protein
MLRGDVVAPLVGIALDEVVRRTGIVNYLFNNTVNGFFDQDLLMNDYQLHFAPSFCNDLVHCRGYGICSPNFYDNSTFQCDCYWQKKGDYCTWSKYDLLNANEFSYQLLQELVG